MNWVWVVLGGMVGAPLRYLTDLAVRARLRGGGAEAFPWGTFTANVAGCALLGLVTGAVAAGAAPGTVALLVGTGLCGALTTFSTFSYETLRLAQDGAWFLAAANVLGSALAGVGAVFVGGAAAAAVWG